MGKLNFTTADINEILDRANVALDTEDATKEELAAILFGIAGGLRINEHAMTKNGMREYFEYLFGNQDVLLDAYSNLCDDSKPWNAFWEFARDKKTVADWTKLHAGGGGSASGGGGLTQDQSDVIDWLLTLKDETPENIDSFDMWIRFCAWLWTQYPAGFHHPMTYEGTAFNVLELNECNRLNIEQGWQLHSLSHLSAGVHVTMTVQCIGGNPAPIKSSGTIPFKHYICLNPSVSTTTSNGGSKVMSLEYEMEEFTADKHAIGFMGATDGYRTVTYWDLTVDGAQNGNVINFYWKPRP